MKEWKTYEDVSRYLLDKFKAEFGLKAVEGKQHLVGISTGTEWEIDAKGVSEKNESIVLIEARRHTKAKLNQEDIGAIAFRVQDTGADSAIVVSPLGLQKGAQMVADTSNITSVEIDANSTPEQFAIKFFGNTVIGAGSFKLTLSTYRAAVESK